MLLTTPQRSTSNVVYTARDGQATTAATVENGESPLNTRYPAFHNTGSSDPEQEAEQIRLWREESNKKWW